MEGCISDRRMLKNNERLYKTSERNYYPVGKYVIHSFKCICNFPCRIYSCSNCHTTQPIGWSRYSSICYDHICNIYHIVWKHKR